MGGCERKDRRQRREVVGGHGRRHLDRAAVEVEALLGALLRRQAQDGPVQAEQLPVVGDEPDVVGREEVAGDEVLRRDGLRLVLGRFGDVRGTEARAHQVDAHEVRVGVADEDAGLAQARRRDALHHGDVQDAAVVGLRHQLAAVPLVCIDVAIIAEGTEIVTCYLVAVFRRHKTAGRQQRVVLCQGAEFAESLYLVG